MTNHSTCERAPLSAAPRPRPESVGRRAFLASAAAALAAGRTWGREFGPQAPPIRYPDPDIVVFDPRFAQYKLGNTPIQRIHFGNLWAEGPAWNACRPVLAVERHSQDVQRRWLDEDGHTSVFRQPAGNSNGNTFDYPGPADLVRARQPPRRALRTRRTESRCWPTVGKDNRSTHPTTSSSIPTTGRSGSPIPAMAA